MTPPTPTATPHSTATTATLSTAGADVFISYARENRALAEQLAAALAQHGLRVWWDRELIAGTRFAERIESELGGARCVLTLWSTDSVQSGFVRDESSRALESGKLIPMRIEAVQLPLGFGQLHTLDLLDWDGDADDPRLADVLAAIAAPRAASAERPATAALPLRAAARPRWRVAAVSAAVACALAGGGALWKQHADATEADQQFRDGLEHQFAREPNLESARNLYLSALTRQPNHARARYYLGHVYAQLGQPALARAAFDVALQRPEQLDAAQRADAGKQVAALRPANEPTPVRGAAADAINIHIDINRTNDHAPAPEAQAQAHPNSSSALPAPEPVAHSLPPRLPLPNNALGRLPNQVAALFEGDRASRISATTSLILDPEALSDAVPLAVTRALSLAALTQPSDTQLSGVINTLVLLQNALPGTLLAHEAEIERLINSARPQGPATQLQADKLATLLQQAQGQRPAAYIQIANDAQRPLAQALSQRLSDRGYATPSIEVVGAARAPRLSEIRVHSKSDRGLARWLSKVMDEFTVEAPQVSTLRNTRPRTDTFEIWLGADLCTTRSVARCKPAP
ncbi:MAG: hypothetical protein RJA98_2009 [Pseudomonadota bacterium]|jgi:hypothetical protein